MAIAPQRAGEAHYSSPTNSDGKAEEETFADYFEVKILKAYKKPFTMCVEEGTYISSHKGELLNSKSEWHQAKIIRTTTRVHQGGADSLRRQEGGGGGAGATAGQLAGRGREGGVGQRGRHQPRDQARPRGQ